MVVAPTLVSIRIIVVLVTLVDVTYVVMGQSRSSRHHPQHHHRGQQYRQFLPQHFLRPPSIKERGDRPRCVIDNATTLTSMRYQAQPPNGQSLYAMWLFLTPNFAERTF